MDIVVLFKVAIMGIVEGLTEFLPISSTGHLILAGALLGFDDEKANLFTPVVVASAFIVGGFIIGAGAYSLYKERALLSMADAPMFAVGLLFSFLSAWLCIRWLLKFISTPQFYRVCVLPHCVWYRSSWVRCVLDTVHLADLQVKKNQSYALLTHRFRGCHASSANCVFTASHQWG